MSSNHSPMTPGISDDAGKRDVPSSNSAGAEPEVDRQPSAVTTSSGTIVDVPPSAGRHPPVPGGDPEMGNAVDKVVAAVRCATSAITAVKRGNEQVPVTQQSRSNGPESLSTRPSSGAVQWSVVVRLRYVNAKFHGGSFRPNTLIASS